MSFSINLTSNGRLESLISRAWKSSLFRSAGIYTGANIVTSAIPFLLLPILTRHLNPADYGIIATFQMLTTMLAPFVGLSVQGIIARNHHENPEQTPELTWNCLIILSATTILASLVVFSFSGFISKWTDYPENWLWAVVATTVAQFVGLAGLTVWQVSDRPWRYVSFQISQTLVNFALSLFLVIVCQWAWQGRIFAQLVSATFLAVCVLGVLYRDKSLLPKWNPKLVRMALSFGVPLIPHALAGWMMGMSDRIFLNKMVGLESTGLYAVALQVTGVVNLTIISFNTAWVPWFYSKLKEKNPKTMVNIVRFTYVYILAVAAVTLLLSFTTVPLLRLLVGKEFQGAGMFIFWLAMARLADSVYYMTCNYLFYAQRTKILAVVTVSSAVVHGLAVYLLIRLYGPIGAAEGTFISSVWAAILTWFAASRTYPMPWKKALTAGSLGE